MASFHVQFGPPGAPGSIPMPLHSMLTALQHRVTNAIGMQQNANTTEHAPPAPPSATLAAAPHAPVAAWSAGSAPTHHVQFISPTAAVDAHSVNSPPAAPLSASNRVHPAPTKAAFNETSPPSREATLVIQPDIDIVKRSVALEDLAPDSPIVRLLIATFVLCVDLFKVCMASLLAVFVPQRCPGNEVLAGTGTEENCTTTAYAHECSFDENFKCLSTFNIVTLVFNFTCLFAFVVHYVCVWRRERWMAHSLTETLTVGRLHLRNQIERHPDLNIRMVRHNHIVFNVSIAAVVLQLVNLAVSGKLVLWDYYADYKSATAYALNAMLIGTMIWHCMDAAYQGLKHRLAYSCVAFEPVSYNDVNANLCKKGE